MQTQEIDSLFKDFNDSMKIKTPPKLFRCINLLPRIFTVCDENTLTNSILNRLSAFLNEKERNVCFKFYEFIPYMANILSNRTPVDYFFLIFINSILDLIPSINKPNLQSFSKNFSNIFQLKTDVNFFQSHLLKLKE